jgi:MGT family glycosyltransferase
VSTYLAYAPAAAGHVFPLVPGLLELQRRGHTVHLRTGSDLLSDLAVVGLTGSPADPRIVAVPVDEHSPGFDATSNPKGMMGLLARGPLEYADLADALTEVRPDALLIDTNAYGAAVAAEASGLPWATTLPSLLPYPGRGIPPYGLGMAPMTGPLGAVRDRVLWKLVERLYARAMLPRLNEMRAAAGLPALRSPLEHVLAPDRLIVLTGAPLEYPRTDLPSKVRLVGAQVWDPPAATPDCVLEDGDPLVLVTCSTDYQGDEALAITAVEALRDEPVRVVLTLADAYGVELPPAANVRVERFVSHAAVLDRAAAVICPAGMGITAKAVAAGVPIVAVPFGRDQPEVARRIVEAGAGVTLPRKRLSAERLRDAFHRAVALAPAARGAARVQSAIGGPHAFADAAQELTAGVGANAA